MEILHQQWKPNMRTISLHSQTNTHPQYHYSPVIEEQETHFSLVNMKSWMCHSVLSAVQCLASADVVYITHVYPPWHTRLSEIGGHHLHNVSSHLSTKTVTAYLAICILWDPLPWPQKINWLRFFPFYKHSPSCLIQMLHIKCIKATLPPCSKPRVILTI